MKRLSQSVTKALRQMGMILPVLLGVILLVGLFKTFVSGELMSSVFVGSLGGDAFVGALFGSLMAGNPVNSYVVGKGLLDMHVGLSGVTAFIFTWVTVGVIQMPAESAALGIKFAVFRAIAAFISALLVAIIVALMVGGVS
ncbi:MAG: hypothetical protein K9N51_01940 [Candidatus Pacebacteria bacterium]|nr:hypothetical protein [Candidatus Paceibacterota bacterium]